MKEKQIAIHYEVYQNTTALVAADRALLSRAREVATNAYAPYSDFCVGAAALVQHNKNGVQIITGTNQENASYPVGICAERVLLSAVSSLTPDATISTIAISYKNKRKEKKTGKMVKSNTPAMPCGMCRQALHEQQQRQKKTFRLILSGQSGEVIIIHNASDLLPLSFAEDFLGK
jgi:cytidine deaminase